MTSILTPFEFSGTETLSRRLYRKKVLPIGSITYNERKIDFTREYLTEMVSAFNDGAFDNVPLQFADAQNNHTNDPERYRGDVVAMSLEDDGLYVTVAATPEGARILEANAKLGISARIINDYDRSDGKHYGAAVQHVLATHDPRIPGLGPWSEVDSFSNPDESAIIDLTTEKFVKPTKDKKHMPKKDNALSNEELASLRAFLAELDADEATDEAPVDASTEDETEDAEDELSDEELKLLLDALNGEEEPADEETPAEEPKGQLADATLSNTGDKALELANAQATELSRIRGELDEAKWQTERGNLMRQHGLSPKILDLAAPVLKGENHTVELSNGDKIDAGKVMRDVLAEVGKLAKLLDLSNELGHSIDAEPDTSEEAAAQRAETTKAIRQMMGN